MRYRPGLMTKYPALFHCGTHWAFNIYLLYLNEIIYLMALLELLNLLLDIFNSLLLMSLSLALES